MDTWALLLKEGGAIAALIVVLFIVKALRARNGNDKAPAHKLAEKSAGLTASEWKSEFRLAVKDMLFETAPKRHEDLRRLIEEILERELAARTGELRTMMKEVIGEWADVRFGKDKGQDR